MFSNLAADSDGPWGKITDKAAAICAVIGAIGGLLEAFSSADSFGGYALYVAIGAVAGAVMGSVIGTLLPWAIGLVVIVLLLKACGIG